MPTITVKSTPLPLLQVFERLPPRVRIIGHTSPREQRENASTGNGGTLYSRENLMEAARQWSKTTPRFRECRWQVQYVDGRAQIVDVKARPGAGPEFFEPHPGQAFDCASLD